MPNASGHLAVAQEVSKKLGIQDDRILIGSILPDLPKDKTKSHYKVPGKIYYVPDIQQALKDLDPNDPLDIGILTHLLLDRYYFDEYLVEKYPNQDLFQDSTIYHDYDILNKDIIQYFQLDVDHIIEVLNQVQNKEYQRKLKKNQGCLFLKEEGKTTYLEKEDFIKFLEEVSTLIAEDIKKYQ